MLPFFPLGRCPTRVCLTNIGTAGVDLERITGFGINQPRDPNVRQIALARILHGDCHNVVPLRQDLQRMRDICFQKIGDDEYDRLLVEHFCDVIDRGHHVGSAPDRLEREEVANDSQHVTPSLSRRNDVLDAIREKKNANAVIVLNRRHRQYRGKLARQLALESSHCPESLRAREIDHQHHRQLALLDVALDEGPAHSGGNVPVDRPDLVARQILSYFRELHSLALEYRAVLPGENGVDKSACPQLDQLYLAQDLGRHSHRLLGSPFWRLFLAPARSENADHGTGIASRMRPTISSLVTSSASASYVRS